MRGSRMINSSTISGAIIWCFGAFFTVSLFFSIFRENMELERSLALALLVGLPLQYAFTVAEMNIRQSLPRRVIFIIDYFINVFGMYPWVRAIQDSELAVRFIRLLAEVLPFALGFVVVAGLSYLICWLPEYYFINPPRGAPTRKDSSNNSGNTSGGGNHQQDR